MEVQASQSNAVWISARGAHTAKAAIVYDQESPPGTKSPKPEVAAVGSGRAVTGTDTSPLSPETNGYLIEATQQDTSTGKNSTALPVAVRHGMEDIANDPEYAAERAKQLAYSSDLVFISKEDFPKNGDPASVWTAFSRKLDTIMSQAEGVQKQRQALYDSRVKEGVPPAEIYAELLDFNANLPQSYGDSLDYSGTNPAGSWTASNAAQRDYLLQVLAKTDRAST